MRERERELSFLKSVRVTDVRNRHFMHSRFSRKLRTDQTRFGCLVKFTSPLPEVALFLPDGGESREPSVNIIDTVLTACSPYNRASQYFTVRSERSLVLRYHPLVAHPLRATSRRRGCQEHRGLYIAPPALSLPIVVCKYDQRIANRLCRSAKVLCE